MSGRDNKVLLELNRNIRYRRFLSELADESRREFLKKLGKGVAMATSGIKPDISAVKKVAKVPSYVDKEVFDIYDTVNIAFQDVMQRNWTGDMEAQLIDRYAYMAGARRANEHSIPDNFQTDLMKKLQFKILGHKYAASPGGPSSLAARDRRYRDALFDNAEHYGYQDEAIESTIATLEDTFDFQAVIDNAFKVAKAKGANSQELDKYLNDAIDASVEADQEADTTFETPEPDLDTRDYQEIDYASGPHMNSFKPVMSFYDFYLTEMKKKIMRNARDLKDEDETDEEMPMTVLAGPGEVEAANKGKKMRKKIPQQPNVAGAPEIINNPGPNYTNQPSLGQVKNRTYKNKNLVSGVFKTNV